MSYQSFLDDAADVTVQNPHFHKVQLSNGIVILKGEIAVLDKIDRRIWETYLIEIHHRDGYPRKFPAVYEVSGKIPQIPDWHINADGTCCISVWPEEILKCLDGINLMRFIEQEVIPYFYNQTHRKIEGYYVNGERAHWTEGILEFYADALGTLQDRTKTVELLKFIANNTRPNLSHPCFCGSEMPFGECHQASYDKLVRIGAENLLFHAELISRELID